MAGKYVRYDIVLSECLSQLLFPQNLSLSTDYFCYFLAARCLSLSVNQNPISNWPTYQGGMYPKRQTHPDIVEKSGVQVCE